MLRREVERPSEEPEWSTMDEHGVFEEDLQVVLPIGKPHEEVTFIHGAEKEVLLEIEPLS